MKSSILLLLCISVVLSKHSAEGKPQEITEIPDEISEVEVTPSRRTPYSPVRKLKYRDSKLRGLRKVKQVIRKVGGDKVPNIVREIATTAKKEIRRGFFDWIMDEIFNMEKLLEIVTDNAKKIYDLFTEAEEKVALAKNSSSQVPLSNGQIAQMSEKMTIRDCKLIGTSCESSDECCLGYCSSSQSCTLQSDR